MKIYRLTYMESDPCPTPAYKVTDYYAAEDESVVYEWFAEVKEAALYQERTNMHLLGITEVSQAPAGKKVHTLHRRGYRPVSNL